jgi:hypothetical protein
MSDAPASPLSPTQDDEKEESEWNFRSDSSESEDDTVANDDGTEVPPRNLSHDVMEDEEVTAEALISTQHANGIETDVCYLPVSSGADGRLQFGRIAERFVGSNETKCLRIKPGEQTDWAQHWQTNQMLPNDALRALTPEVKFIRGETYNVSVGDRGSNCVDDVVTSKNTTKNTNSVMRSASVETDRLTRLVKVQVRVFMKRITNLCVSSGQALDLERHSHEDAEHPTRHLKHTLVDMETLRSITGRSLYCLSCALPDQCHLHDIIRQWIETMERVGLYAMIPENDAGPMIRYILITYSGVDHPVLERYQQALKPCYRPFLRLQHVRPARARRAQERDVAPSTPPPLTTAQLVWNSFWEQKEQIRSCIRSDLQRQRLASIVDM